MAQQGSLPNLAGDTIEGTHTTLLRFRGNPLSSTRRRHPRSGFKLGGIAAAIKSGKPYRALVHLNATRLLARSKNVTVYLRKKHCLGGCCDPQGFAGLSKVFFDCRT